MNLTKLDTIYIVEIRYNVKQTKYKTISRYRYYSLEKAEEGARFFKAQLGNLIDSIIITKEHLEIL
jgi:uncharacterized surface anchored protein